MDKQNYVQPSGPATFQQDGWHNAPVVQTERDTYALLWGLTCIAVLIGLVLYVALSILS